MIRTHMGSKVHACPVEPAEERLVSLTLAIDEIHRCSGSLVIDRFHPLFSQGTGVLDGLLANAAETRIFRGIVAVGGLALHDAARAEVRAERGVFWIVEVLGLFLGIEVI